MQPNQQNNQIKNAVQSLKNGEVIAYPTEAVYGLGCDPFNFAAIQKLLKIKQRDIQKGFILVAANWEQVKSLTQPVDSNLLKNALNTWPGPVTWLFPAKPDVPSWLTGNHPTIAIRVSAHPIVQALCQAFGGPITSTSANKAGESPITDYQTVIQQFSSEIKTIVAGQVGSEKKPSQILELMTGNLVRK